LPAGPDARRFFTAPDVAFKQPRGQSAWFNLAIGSGDSDEASATGVQNRFYSLRDREPFARKSQAEYDSASPILDADLTPVAAAATNVPDDAPGWKLDLRAGEQVLAEPTTANSVVMFTTHEPGASLDGSLCASDDVNRVYALRVESADAALDLNDDAQVTDADRSAVLEQKGVAPGVRIETPAPGRAVPAGAAPGEPGALPAAPPSSAPATCFAGIERLSHCVSIDTVLRTFWKRTSTN